MREREDEDALRNIALSMRRGGRLEGRWVDERVHHELDDAGG